MKLSTFSSMPLLALAVFCFTSCGSQDDKKTPESTPTDTSTTAAAVTPTPAPASTVSTTPENVMVVRHKVANFNKWLTSYDQHDSMRTASGVHNYVIGRGVKDSQRASVAGEDPGREHRQ